MMIGKLGMENASNLNGVLFVIPTKPNSQCDGRLAMRTSTIGSIFLIIVLSVTGQAFADSMIAPNLPHYLFNEIPFTMERCSLPASIRLIYLYFMGHVYLHP